MQPLPHPRTLVVGSTGHAHVRCIDWSELAGHNVVDYDAIVFVVASLTPELVRAQEPDLRKIRTNLARLMASRGTLIILCEPEVRTEVRRLEYRSNFEWCPIIVGQVRETGETVTVKSAEFPKLMGHLQQWDSFFFLPNGCLTHELTELLGYPQYCEYSLPIIAIAENRYGKPLAAKIAASVTVLATDKKRELGNIFLLPSIARLEKSEAVNLVLEDWLSLPQTTIPPTWAEQTVAPGSLALQAAMDERQIKIDQLENEIASLFAQKAELDAYKKLMYATGPELEDIVARCLQELGGTILDSKYSDEEFVLHYEGRDYPVECKGVTKSISKTHVRQLMDYMDVFEERTGAKGKGLLFGNAWRTLSPQERSKAGEYFPSNVVERAEANGIGLISTVDFYDAFSQVLLGKRPKEELMATLLNASGVVKFG